MYVFIWVEEQKKQTVIKKTKQTEETSMQKAKQTQLWCLVSASTVSQYMHYKTQCYYKIRQQAYY